MTIYDLIIIQIIDDVYPVTEKMLKYNSAYNFFFLFFN